MKGKKINFQVIFNIFIVITISVLLYFHFQKKESFEGIAGSSFVSRVPKGTIVAYYPPGGDLSKNPVPAGWALCDGNNGTPDLKSKFILGYESGVNNIGATGGTKEETLTSDQMPKHSHSVSIPWRSFARDSGQTGFLTYYDQEGDAGFNTSEAGGNQAHNNMPPYYILAYIMKL